jgi:hypothetical protein
MDKVWEFYLVLISDRKGIHKKVKIKIKSDKKKKKNCMVRGKQTMVKPMLT